jgi:hypothetical protein
MLDFPIETLDYQSPHTPASERTARKTIPPTPHPFSHLSTQLPFWSLVALGAYALGNIGWNLMRFNSCPEAADELQRVSKWVGRWVSR